MINYLCWFPEEIGNDLTKATMITAFNAGLAAKIFIEERSFVCPINPDRSIKVAVSENFLDYRLFTVTCKMVAKYLVTEISTTKDI